MARKPRILSKAEDRELNQAILSTVPKGKSNAITRRDFVERMENHLASKKIPVSIALKRLQKLRARGRVAISTRVGIWRGSKDDKGPAPMRVGPHGFLRGTLQHPQRRIRKVVSFICTRCYHSFPSKSAAKEHLKTAHPAHPAH